MAPRTSALSERLFWRLSVIGGNMCSEGYVGGRTEMLGRSGIPRADFADPTAQRGIASARVQPILHTRPKPFRTRGNQDVVLGVCRRESIDSQELRVDQEDPHPPAAGGRRDRRGVR